MDKMHIMVVDDHKHIRQLVQDILLKTKSYLVTSATSGEACLRKLHNQNINLVLLDLQLCGMDGIETLREIKKANPLTEVIMLTGHATVETAIEGMKLGAYDYLMKPCDIEQLLLKVEGAAQKKHGHEEKIKEARVKEALSKHGLE